MSRGPEGDGPGSVTEDCIRDVGRATGGGARAVCPWILGVAVRRGLYPSLGPGEMCFLTVSQPSKAVRVLKRQSL